MLKNEKGLTILELIVAMGLSSLVIMLAIQMYITNSSNFKLNEQQTELTSIAHQILSEVSELGLESSGISKIRIGGKSYMNRSLGLINEETLSKAPSIDVLKLKGSNIELTYDADNQTLSDGSQTFEGVTRFVAMPIPENSKFNEANGIKILLEVESNKLRKPVRYETTTIIGFRNKVGEE